MTTNYRPSGFHSITPYLTVQGADRLITFLKQAYLAEEILREARPDGAIGNAQVKIGDSMVEVSDATAQWQPTPCALHLYVPDVDAVYARAIAAGATSLQEPTDQAYGDRDSAIRDPFGNRWYIATHKAEASPEGA